MNEHDEDTRFERRAAELLRTSISGTDGATRARLSRARAAAVDAAARRPGWLEFRYLAPVGAVAGAALAAVLLFGPGKPAAPVNVATVAALYDMDLLSDAEAFDIAQESDLGFIEWAAAQGEQGESGG
jgi:hypothetical protein